MSFKLKLLAFQLSVATAGFILVLQFKELSQLQFQDWSACDSCMSENSGLLSSRLNRSVEPVLSSKTNLSEEAFRWWKRLQNERRDFRFFKKTVHKLFQIFPRRPKLRKQSPDTCRTCAVVGNSANLNGSHYGPLIDYQDVVMRMNFAKIKGYEAHVGTKTTYHVMYPESAMNLHNSTHLVFFPYKIMDLEWLIKAFTTGFYERSYAPVKTKIRANKDLVMVINPEFMKYSHEKWLEKEGAYPSTGFMTLIFALHICDEIHVFGFGADSDGNWSHYFEELTNKTLKTGSHPGIREYDIIQELAKEKMVKFYKGHDSALISYKQKLK
ncbi:CMP-N-acetylneuraminate-beta-galactosamide-alpha-2,3-sialyltransferase 1-like [Xiphophorus hellerii]|uniref:CMP-N-acetylneuraminate-beta-galactosamide- alpha-2,3-sialyltransferase 1-like n=1 Tax=Xiphophorus hellerii TaxID=8084 RepID=UPI0013B45899|nr:CMP-N-acetylneuraminate-beta-galactosamide-alpha-2,3-sialyltransferase 1-like [Xiphophorus hellerii]XP_032437472.1 CMP-N-acetylneuraminate-beta-galactosamide-alpha-2,3-sialyltransferase 1-like [Xiphophorus hellerii]